MTSDFFASIIGLIIFSITGANIGIELSPYINLSPQVSTFLFGLVGVLIGVILTPWLTTRPIRVVSRSINEWPIERLMLSLSGILIGLVIALLLAYPLSLLPGALGTYIPPFISVAMAYLGIALFGTRSKEIIDFLSTRMPRGGMARASASSPSRKLLLDTSVLIDGRITDIAETGFIGGTLILPRFVLSELHRVADSPDALRRNRGRRGLNMLNKIQRDEIVPVRIVDDDFDDIPTVDDKLIALAIQMTAAIITNDYNLNQVADAQGVPVLNINQLANAVRSVYIPGEIFAIRILQEGSGDDQGVGYLEDGTMVVVEHGRKFMDRTVDVEVTKLINRDTGRMIFAIPAE